jgi:NAD(P)-dependent dehydrogenase (short-subunit alcohol dehydrogenase family)
VLSALSSFSAEHGVRAKFIHTDVSKEEDVKAMVDFVKDNFGRLDYAFDNAGVLTEVFDWYNLAFRN